MTFFHIPSQGVGKPRRIAQICTFEKDQFT